MAREESSREDLLRDATALVERIELEFGGDRIVAGFRADGSLSIFFGEDPVYQFSATGELRRAFVGGRLIKAVCGQLISLQRHRTEQEVQLVRHELNASEQADLLSQMTQRLRSLEAYLSSGTYTIVGKQPANTDIIGRLRSWFETHAEWPVADRPNVGG